MGIILQQERSSDCMIATGITTEVREFVWRAFEYLGIELGLRGQGAEEIGLIKSINTERFAQIIGAEYTEAVVGKIGDTVVAVDKKYFRPTEVDLLLGDPTKAQTELNWKPEYDIPALVADMMQADVKVMKKEAYLAAGGYKTLNYFE